MNGSILSPMANLTPRWLPVLGHDDTGMLGGVYPGWVSRGPIQGIARASTMEGQGQYIEGPGH